MRSQRHLAAEAYEHAFAEGFRPEPRLTVSAWAGEHCFVGSRTGQAAERFDLPTTPYLRDVMDALGPKTPWHRVVAMFGSQLGKTTAGLNWTSFIIAHCPAPTLLVRPGFEEAREFSRERLDPMIDATPELKGRVVEARSRDGGNTLLRKEFAGGFLTLSGSNSPRGLKSKPIRFLFCDEIDDYPGDVKGQGDPIVLAEKRCHGPNFQRRKVLLVSTPTLKGLSRIEREYLASDRRRFYIPCPLCGHMDFLTWRGEDRVSNVAGMHHWIDFDEGHPATARMICSSCGERVAESYKPQMLARGEWRPTSTATKPDTIGFHLSSLYSPLGWLPWSAIAAEFLEVKESMLQLKGWVNSVLAETWEESGDSIEPEGILARIERWEKEVPAGVGVLVAAVDVQGDRLEVAVNGYGAGEESWLIAYGQIDGDPGRDHVWHELDSFLAQEFEHESGQMMRIMCVTVDSGDGHFSEQVYRFCRARVERRVFAVKGGSEIGRPIVGKPSRVNRYKTPLFIVCTDTAKELIYSRLRIEKPKVAGQPTPGLCHFPEWIDAEYAAQVTAEKAIRKWIKGKGSVRQWIPLRERNEALDLQVYCLAALYILGPGFVKSLGERAAAFARKLEAPVVAEGDAAPAPAARQPRGWIDGALG